MAQASTREVIEGIFADAATGDLDRVLRWWSDDGTLEDVSIARAFIGKEELREYLRWYYAALPEVRYEPIRLLVDGPTAVVEWQQSTRVVGEFDGIPPSDQEVYLHAIDVFDVRDGLIQHEVSWYGDAWLRQRLHGETGSDVRPALPLTPPLHADGTRFGGSTK
ncbi:MAG: SnoaL-like polyketide cyclase [Blastococcus sp.]|jgi:steroid delta-isomerase-like uncharacterized protein|nr:SnoaL-like polyketide cyclase [Blastococcus sp.]